MKTTILSFFIVLLSFVPGLAQVLSSSANAYVISGPGISRVPAGYGVQFEVLEQHKGFDVFAKELKGFISASTQLYAREEGGVYKYRLGNFATEGEAALLKKQLRLKTRYKDAWVVYDAGGMPALPDAAGSPSSYEYLAPRSPAAASTAKTFAIQLGAYEVRPGPGDFSSVSKLGAIYAVREGKWYKARLGPYPTKDAAAKALREVQKHYPKAYVTEDAHAASLPGSSSAAPASAQKAGSANTYTVKDDDTLYGIARKAGTTVYRLRELNQLPPDGKIRPGQVLRLQ